MATAANTGAISLMQHPEVSSELVERSAVIEASDSLSAAIGSSTPSSIEPRDVASALTDRVEATGVRVNVGIESVNGTVVFTVTDQRTGSVLRKIPSDEALRITRNIDELTGILVDRME